MNSPFLSVIIPVYNVEDYLEQCVNSILAQDYKDLEIILVDDGSKDGSPVICDEYARKYSFISAIHKKNGGASSARNKGVEAAKGKYVCFVDSDDWWNEHVSLNTIIDTVKQNPDDAIFTFSAMGYNQKTRQCYIDKTSAKVFDVLSGVVSIENYYKILVKYNFLRESSYAYIIKKELIINNKLYFHEELVSGEDTEWMFRVLRCIKRIVITDGKYFYVYRRNRTGSITNSISIKNVEDLLNIMDASYNFYLSNNQKTNILKYEMAYISYLWILILRISIDLPDEQKRYIKQQLKKRDGVFNYAVNRMNKMVYLIYKICGIDMISFLFSIFYKRKGKKE